MMNADYLEIIEDQIFIGNSVEDLTAEISENFWQIAMSNEERSTISVEDLLDFYNKLIARRSEQVKEVAKHGMIFYTWHDAQASQLRFCLISDFHPRLPFGAEILDASLEEILEEFLAAYDSIPFSELVFVEENLPEPEPAQRPSIKVYQQRIP